MKPTDEQYAAAERIAGNVKSNAATELRLTGKAALFMQQDATAIAAVIARARQADALEALLVRALDCIPDRGTLREAIHSEARALLDKEASDEIHAR